MANMPRRLKKRASKKTSCCRLPVETQLLETSFNITELMERTFNNSFKDAVCEAIHHCAENAKALDSALADFRRESAC